MKKSHWLKITLVLLIFAVSRAFIYLNPPPNYSDVKADYERYANMWRYGLTPYREHLYEYPPATVPLLSLPLELDQRGIGTYYPNYRAQILLVDTAFFLFLLATVIYKLPWTKKRWMPAALTYVLITTIAKDFFYEGIDLAFTATALAAFLIPAWFKKTPSWLGQGLSWLFFWLSTAIKFLTIPLAAPLFFIFSGSFLKKAIFAGLGFALTWGIAGAIYGSSLSVSFVYNNARPIKYASFPAYIIKVVDHFTQTESRVDKAPDFPSEGPVSTTVTNINKVFFPVAVLAVVVWGMLQSKKVSGEKTILKSATLLGIYGVYTFTLFLTAKTFSQPFHIWYLPLLLVFPFVTKRQWWLAAGLSTLMVVMDTTPWLTSNIFPFLRSQPWALLRDIFRFAPMVVMLWVCISTTNQITSTKKVGEWTM